jgi:SAM-dependent methyltransferase
MASMALALWLIGAVIGLLRSSRAPKAATTPDADSSEADSGMVLRSRGGMSVRCRCQNQGVVPLDGLHGERDRAGSFGSGAEQYDRYRPGYPSALIDELVSLSPANALDVGCGTGKVAVLLRARGVPVLGVEPDARMAEVARRHQVPIEVAPFESWEPAGRTYDLVTAGHSWHWIDPLIGLAKAASITVPGATVALFWNYHVVDETLLPAFDDAYRAHAPELTVIGRDPTGNGVPDTDPFQSSTDLRALGNRIYRWPRILDAEEWTTMLATFSDHARLGEPRLRDLQLALRTAIERAGGVVRSQCGTYVWMARRLEQPADR